MAFSKAHVFSPAYYHFSLLCKALSHPARIEIVQKVFDRDPEMIPAHDLSANLPIIRSSASEHLKILRDMHILKCEGLGPRVTYCLNTELPNTCQGIGKLISLANEKHDPLYWSELPLIASRRTIGAIPI
jgi:DNA-binding transcriptional ArsR family regulator